MRTPVVAPASVRNEGRSVWVVQLVFMMAHVPLALVIPKHSRLGTLHAILVLVVGLIVATIPRRPQLVACAAAYVTGAAVFWRMRAAPQIPWEFSKYAIIMMLGLALMLSGRLRRATLPLSYAVLLLPSAILTLTKVPWESAREMLSFNLSGPLTLTVALLFFYSARFSPAQMRWVTVSLLAPIVGIGAVAAESVQKALADPEFGFSGGTSNAATSGGFGPNQVSAALGLGILAAVIYLILGARNRVSMGAMILMILFLARQALLTLSRGGAYMALGGVVAASLILIGERRLRRKLALASVVVVAALVLYVIPKLQAQTGGVLVSRFENTGGTGRELLIKGDFDSWSQNPILGVGPGLGGVNRLRYFDVASAHTEYTRMVAEHGLFGLAALIVLMSIAVGNIRGQKLRRSRAISAALIAYALLFMSVDATRLSAPAFAFGLSGATIVVAKRKGSPIRPTGRAPVAYPGRAV